MYHQTNSGTIRVNKRTPYGKIIEGFVSTAKWTGGDTVRQGYLLARSLRDHYPSLSFRDAGRLAAVLIDNERFYRERGR